MQVPKPRDDVGVQRKRPPTGGLAAGTGPLDRTDTCVDRGMPHKVRQWVMQLGLCEILLMQSFTDEIWGSMR